jgi:hypothetical protein
MMAIHHTVENLDYTIKCCHILSDEELRKHCMNGSETRYIEFFSQHAVHSTMGIILRTEA